MVYVAYVLPRCYLFLWLALRAEVGAAIADGDALYGSATLGAEFTANAVGNLKLKVSCPQFTARAKIGIYTSPFITNG